MICQFCKKAGEIWAGRPKGELSAADLGVLGVTSHSARHWHERCPGGTWCDCAHATEERIDWFKVGLTKEKESREQEQEDSTQIAEYSIPG